LDFDGYLSDLIMWFWKPHLDHKEPHMDRILKLFSSFISPKRVTCFNTGRSRKAGKEKNSCTENYLFYESSDLTLL
jgi:hypothetical protein